MTAQPPPGTNRRTVTGQVTKLVGEDATYGFINDEIFFQQASVTGGPASVGDQVYADCEYSAHLPIKWNATSLRIVAKAQNQQQSSSQMLPNDPMKAQFNQAPDQVAVTYQQHRQQRMNRQGQDVDKQEQGNQQKQQNPPRLLDQAMNQGDYFSMNDPRSFQQKQQQQQQKATQQAPSLLNPIVESSPMGPPNFAFTSQLGSAFVQNQFVPTAFLPHQQAAPMLPQQPPQQLLLPQNQGQNQRHNQPQNKAGGNSRNFNNQGENKNDNRQNNRRGNRNDRGRSKDRDGLNKNNNNNRSSNNESNNNRDKSASRGNKRDDPPVRPSPPPHSSARSSTSVSSDKGARGRKHYDVQNIPKSRIMANMNPYNMRQRCPASIHVPSDLKEVIVNQYFRLDIKNTPKPLRFSIEEPTQREEQPKSDQKEAESEEVKDNENVMSDTGENATESSESKGENPSGDDKSVTSASVDVTPTSKPDVKLNHKYGVKVILISLPELNSIYKSVFGLNLDSFSSDSKSSNKRLDEVISLLCIKGANNGHSLVGGKFDPLLDGFALDQNNEFERHNRQPDLIATCKRIVLEQTNLDLSDCKSWTHVSTFVYNNRSDYFSPKSSVEYSYVYLPHIWTLEKGAAEQSIPIESEPSETKIEDSQDPSDMPVSSEESETPVNQEASMDVTENSDKLTEQMDHPDKLSLENIGELKVVDLKSELDKKDIKYKPNAKKAELVALLRESLQITQDNEEVEVKPEPQSEPVEVQNTTESEDLVTEETTEEQDESKVELPNDVHDSEGSAKRKIDESMTEDGKENLKKLCSEDSILEKEQPVELIENSFKVRPKPDSQLALVSINETSQVGRHDQFELSVSSNILKESLIQHLSEYIFTCLVEDTKQRLNISSNSTSLDPNSDSNNNNDTSKSAFKNATQDSKKELPVDRYVNLAFSYFDSTHMGYLYFEDLNKLFNNTGYTVSKRALMTLIGDGDKFSYRSLPDISAKMSPTYIYEFPQHFKRLPSDASAGNSESSDSSCKMIQYKGVAYDVEKLVEQVRESETLRVSLFERFNYAIANSDKQAEEIHVLEVNQKSLAKAIKAQNDEICELKRERDILKKKLEGIRKGVKGTVTSLSDLIKEDN